MLLFRLVDVPRRVRRLARPLPLDPTATRTDGRSGPAVVGWTLTPTLLSPRGRRLRSCIAQVLALYAEAEGQPRAAVEALSPRIEEITGDYRLGRCIARTVEHCAYQFVPPPVALPHEPAALRALCYRRAQEQYNGYVPRDRRAAFLAAVAADLDTTPVHLEAALWADRAGAALLQPRPELADSASGKPATDLRPARVIARYNAAAVATVVAASSLVGLRLAASDTTALKDLYRHAKALHVGLDIAQGARADVLDLTLYGPGSRALVRSRAAIADGEGADETYGGDGTTALGAAATADAAIAGHGAGSVGDDSVRVPAPGGSAVAAVVARLVRRRPAAVLGGWTRLLGSDRRLYHVPLEEDLLAALHADQDEVADAAGDGDLYDSAVEEGFAHAFHAHEPAGRGGVVRGWTVQREPRAIVVDGTVFLPDFIFRRGDVEVYGEVIGYYTEDYLARKKRKLAALYGQLPLLLIVDRELAPVFSDIGFPIVTYRAGRQIGVTDVISALEQAFDPFVRRRGRALAVLTRLCTTAGPDLVEEDLSVATGCAGRSELLTLWADLLAGAAPHGDTATEELRRVAEAREPYSACTSQQPTSAGAAQQPDMTRPTQEPHIIPAAQQPYSVDDAADRFPRRYLPGYGLVQSSALTAARTALIRLLREAGAPVPLQDALACVSRAGVPGPDEALLERLGAAVARADLFGEAHVYLPDPAALPT